MQRLDSSQRVADPLPGTHALDARIYRVARRPDPWTWVPWQYAPFGGRWDDPLGLYRVLYAGASRFACSVEALAEFRPDPTLLALYGALNEYAADDDFGALPPGLVPARWTEDRFVGSARARGRMIAIGDAETLAWLRPHVAGLLTEHRMPDLDGAAIRSASRAFTQHLSRWLYSTIVDDGPIDGIEFESRHGNRLVLWAVFERAADESSSRLLTDHSSEPINRTDPDLERALALHGLRLI